MCENLVTKENQDQSPSVSLVGKGQYQDGIHNQSPVPWPVLDPHLLVLHGEYSKTSAKLFFAVKHVPMGSLLILFRENQM